MGYELSYETWINGVGSRELDDEIESTKSTIEFLKQSIFALICMPPNMVQNKKPRHKNSDDESWPNDEYIVQRWRNLYEELEENISRLARLHDAKGSVERKERKVYLCPKCNREIYGEYSSDDKGWRWFCPNCGKFEGDFDYDQLKNHFTEAIIRTFSEG